MPDQRGEQGQVAPGYGWWTEIPEDTAFMDAWSAMQEHGKLPEPKHPCVLCGFECDLAKTPIFAAVGPRGTGSAHLWCSHILKGAENAKLREENARLREENAQLREAVALLAEDRDESVIEALSAVMRKAQPELDQ